MHARVEAHFQRQVDWFVAGRFDDFACGMVYPFALYMKEERVIISDRLEMATFMEHMRDGYFRSGRQKTHIRVQAVSLPQNDRFRVWLDQTDIGAQGELLQVAGVLHYCRRAPQGFRTEMSVYQRDCAPEALVPKARQGYARNT